MEECEGGYVRMSSRKWGKFWWYVQAEGLTTSAVISAGPTQPLRDRPESKRETNELLSLELRKVSRTLTIRQKGLLSWWMTVRLATCKDIRVYGLVRHGDNPLKYYSYFLVILLLLMAAAVVGFLFAPPCDKCSQLLLGDGLPATGIVSQSPLEHPPCAFKGPMHTAVSLPPLMPTHHRIFKGALLFHPLAEQ